METFHDAPRFRFLSLPEINKLPRDGSNRASLLFSAIDQRTVPEELPVSGDPYNETMLELIFPGRAALFKLNGKKLQLLEALDRDDENLSHVVFQVRDKKTANSILQIKSELYLYNLYTRTLVTQFVISK